MRQQKSQRGANVLEAALTILVLMTMVFGLVDFGRAFNVYQVITDAAREGARYSVAPNPGTTILPTPSAVQAYVESYLADGNIRGATVNVNQSYAKTVNSVPTMFTEVTVTETYASTFFPFTITIRTRAVMRNETN